MGRLDEERTHCETMISVISATLENRATADISQYQVGGQLITKMPIKDLLYYRGYYTSKLQRIKQMERAQQGKATGRLVKVAF